MFAIGKWSGKTTLNASTPAKQGVDENRDEFERHVYRDFGRFPGNHLFLFMIVVGYHGIDTERLHSSAHPNLVVANTQFSSTILICVKSLLLGAIPEPDTY